MSEHRPSRYLQDRVLLVTGAGRGIGRAVALLAARNGALVAVNDIDPDEARDTVASITTDGGTAVAIAGSVGDISSLAQLVRGVESSMGPIDALVSNAGIPSSGRACHRTDIAEVDELFRVHALGPFELCRLVLPGMRARRKGTIVMVSSQSTAVAPSHGAPYTMAKAALEALARTLANENQSFGIRVNIVAPGVVDTRLGHLVMDRLAGHTDLPSPDILMIEPDTVARTVCFLISDASAGITGERVTISAQPRLDGLATGLPRHKEFA